MAVVFEGTAVGCSLSPENLIVGLEGMFPAGLEATSEIFGRVGDVPTGAGPTETTGRVGAEPNGLADGTLPA